MSSLEFTRREQESTATEEVILSLSRIERDGSFSLNSNILLQREMLKQVLTGEDNLKDQVLWLELVELNSGQAYEL